MGFFTKRWQQPDKQNSGPRRQTQSSSSSTSESTARPSRLTKPQRAPYELSGQSSDAQYNGNDNAAAAEKQNIILELELARQRTRVRELEANQLKMKQAVAFSTQTQLGIPPDFAPSVVDSLTYAPEVVVGGMDSEAGTSSGYSPSASGALIPTHEGARIWPHEPPTVHHTTQQQSPPSPPQPPSFDIANVFAAISTLPWSKAFGTLVESSSNPGLLLLLFALLYFTYSIIMTRALYLLLAFGIGIVAYNARKTFFIAKQAELQGEYMRSIASNLQTVEMVPPDVSSSRLLLPAGMNRVDELN
ncbi:hypothetical protein BDV96DRAFT_599243 [Lophiotrema nucula]|uniref:Uncharacterized protein n=1 Tax=Lophiotrema nucula TaxID=690887 RepID=A0A6A5Z9S9_9PLEO|nr:hypothetical protein BDV96DRAFT_599243 [Lophiotrema nucula]